MDENNTDFKSELNELEARCRRLASEKAYLQLVNNLMGKLGSVSGLDALVKNMLMILIENFGGTNAILFYKIDNEYFYCDALGDDYKLYSIDDNLVNLAFQTRKFSTYETDFTENRLKTNKFTSSWTWIIPLSLGDDVIGVIKLENLHHSSKELINELPVFFNFAALMLKNEISGVSKLKKAYEMLKLEIEVRKEAEKNIKELMLELEERVKERTSELTFTNMNLKKEIIERKKTEEALRKSERYNKSIIETANEGIWIMDGVYVTTYVNKKMAEMLGYKIEEMIGKKVTYFMVPHDLSDHSNKMSERKQGKSGHYERRFVKKNGDVIWTLVSSTAFVDEKGKFHGSFGMFSDITERKKIEDTLFFLLSGNSETGEDFFYSLAKYLSECLEMDYVCIDQLEDDKLTAITLAIYHNGNFEDNVSYTLADTPCGKVVDNSYCCYKKGITELFPNDAVLRQIRAESYMGTTLISSAGKPIGLIALISRRELENTKIAESVLKIVSVRATGELERRFAEKSLLESEERYRAIVESSYNSLCLLDDHGKIKWVNDNMIEISGYSAEQIYLSDSFVQFIAPESLEFVVSNFGRLVAGLDYIHHYQFSIIRADGEKRLLEKHMMDFINKYGKREIIISMIDITDRNKAELSLKESEEKYRRLAEDNPIFVGTFTPEGVITYINSAMATVFNENPENLINQNIFDLFDSEAAQQIKENNSQLNTSQPIVTYEQAFNDANGQEHWHHWTSRAFFNAESDLQYIQAIGIDITERKKAERALKDSEERYRRVITNVNEAITVSLIDKIVFANQKTFELLEYSKEEIYSIPYVNFIYPEDREFVIGNYMALLEGEKLYRLPARFLTKSGSVRWFELSGVPIEWDGQLAVLSFISDVTERKNAEEALRRSETQLRTIFENIGEGIGYVNKNEIFQFANPSAEKIFGTLPGGLVGKNLFDFISEDQKMLIVQQNELRRKNERSIYDLEVKSAKGEKRTITVTAVPQFSEGNQFVGTFGIFRDTTERKNYERSIAEEKERLAVTLRSIGDGVITTDIDGRIIIMNKIAEELTAWKQAEKLPGRNWKMFLRYSMK